MSGFAPDEGENLTDLQSKFPAPGAIPYFRQHQLPDGGNEFTLAPEGFHESFCADLPADDAAFYAISQRPLAGVALTEAAPAPAWRTRPAWAVFGTADRCIDPGVHRFSYDRMGATVTEIEGASHVVMISHPKEVAQVVMTAGRTLRRAVGLTRGPSGHLRTLPPRAGAASCNSHGGVTRPLIEHPRERA